MFSKSKINEPIETSPKPKQTAQAFEQKSVKTAQQLPSLNDDKPKPQAQAQPVPQPEKTSTSVISQDLHITGNLETAGAMQIEGTVEGDIRSESLTIGPTATIRGEVVADYVEIHGRVVGQIRGMRVHLAKNAQVDGDIMHNSIAIEVGAHFEGSVQRSENPLQRATESEPPLPGTVMPATEQSNQNIDDLANLNDTSSGV